MGRSPASFSEPRTRGPLTYLHGGTNKEQGGVSRASWPGERAFGKWSTTITVVVGTFAGWDRLGARPFWHRAPTLAGESLPVGVRETTGASSEGS